MSDWPSAVLFDFDGVIVNSEPLHFFAFHEVLRGEKIELTEEEYYRELIGFDDRGGFKHVYEKHAIPLDARTLLRLMTRKSEVVMELIHRKQYHALPGVEEFVRGLWRHYPLAICSGALREEVEAMLEGVSLRDCFPTIVAAEDVTVGKPDPGGYLLAATKVSERIGRALRPADCMIVEDAPSVCHTTRGVGFPVLAVTTSHPAEKFGEANWVVKTLEPREVSKLIPQLKLKV
ncbi:MAG TPA: HAD family phosphatase [Tepidisphaeraceae bacterium]|nr:HAD family phosphatase [Tepidisphaeraceae bacterium]